jgi:hypothetical protein
MVFAATFGVNWSPIGAAAARRIAGPQGKESAHQDDRCDHLMNPPGNAKGIDKKCPETGSSSGISRGDFNADGFADLAIGEPGAQVGSAAGAGDVIVLYGSANGLTVNTTGTPRRQLWTEARIPAHLSFANLTPEADDAFGSALASGDFNGDGFSDLAIGIPNKKLTTIPQDSVGPQRVGRRGRSLWIDKRVNRDRFQRSGASGVARQRGCQRRFEARRSSAISTASRAARISAPA